MSVPRSTGKRNDSVCSRSKPNRRTYRRRVIGLKYHRCSSRKQFHFSPLNLAAALDKSGKVAKNKPPAFKRRLTAIICSSMAGKCSSTSHATAKSNEAENSLRWDTDHLRKSPEKIRLSR